MARRPKPWYRKARDAWFVTVNGVQHNLGAEKRAAFAQFYELMRAPKPRPVSPRSLAAIVDEFLEWTKRERSPDTFEWYRYRLQRLVDQYPAMRPEELRPFHVQKWVDKYKLSVTSRRNYMRTIKRCLKWAVRQGYIERNPIAELEVPNAERRESVITEQQFREMLDLIRDPTFRDLLVVTWETGCRPQESL